MGTGGPGSLGRAKHRACNLCLLHTGWTNAKLSMFGGPGGGLSLLLWLLDPLPCPCEVPPAPDCSHNVDWPGDRPLQRAFPGCPGECGPRGRRSTQLPTHSWLQTAHAAPPTDLLGPVGSPRGSRGWRRSYCLSDRESRSAPGARRKTGHQTGVRGELLGLSSPATPAAPGPAPHRGQRLPQGVPGAAGRCSAGAWGVRDR